MQLRRHPVSLCSISIANIRLHHCIDARRSSADDHFQHLARVTHPLPPFSFRLKTMCGLWLIHCETRAPLSSFFFGTLIAAVVHFFLLLIAATAVNRLPVCLHPPPRFHRCPLDRCPPPPCVFPTLRHRFYHLSSVPRRCLSRPDVPPGLLLSQNDKICPKQQPTSQFVLHFPIPYTETKQCEQSKHVGRQ